MSSLASALAEAAALSRSKSRSPLLFPSLLPTLSLDSVFGGSIGSVCAAGASFPGLGGHWLAGDAGLGGISPSRFSCSTSFLSLVMSSWSRFTITTSVSPFSGLAAGSEFAALAAARSSSANAALASAIPFNTAASTSASFAAAAVAAAAAAAMDELNSGACAPCSGSDVSVNACLPSCDISTGIRTSSVIHGSEASTS